MAQSRFFNVKDFNSIDLNAPRKATASFSADEAMDAKGKQPQYDVFLSHSTKDKNLIKKIRRYLEDNNGLSVYIDWDEDEGTHRDDIADVVRTAMKRSKTFLVVKTENSDESSWVSWETGFYDNLDSNKIGVLLVEDPEKGFTRDTFNHQEYLKNYMLLMMDDLLNFVAGGRSAAEEAKFNKRNNAFLQNSTSLKTDGSLSIGAVGTGITTKFYGD